MKCIFLQNTAIPKTLFRFLAVRYAGVLRPRLPILLVGQFGFCKQQTVKKRDCASSGCSTNCKQCSAVQPQAYSILQQWQLVLGRNPYSVRTLRNQFGLNRVQRLLDSKKTRNARRIGKDGDRIYPKGNGAPSEKITQLTGAGML